MNDMLIVKFGGSSIPPFDLSRWVEAVEGSSRPTVIVPGGGPFAGTVRRLQGQIGYDNEAARAMTVLAMEQFARALCSLGTRLKACESEEAIASAVSKGRVAVWLPVRAAMRGKEPVWDTTMSSDGFAARLASRFPGATLCLIKKIDLPAGRDLHAVTAAGVVDPAFEAMLHPATRLYVAGPSDLPLAAHRLSKGQVPGQEVLREDEAQSVREAAQ